MESDARYRALFEQSPIGVFTFDRDLRLTECNLAFVRLMRSKVESLVGLDLRTLNDPRILPAVERVLEGEPLYVEGPYQAQNSDVRLEVATWVTPLRDAEGEVTGGLGLVQDVTERRARTRREAQMQLQLMQSDRLATVGVLATGIAHEINNPLAYVMTNLEIVARHYLPEMTALAANDEERQRIARVAKMVDEARQGAERMRRVVRDVKSFARGDDDSREAVDVREVLDAALHLVAHDLRQRGRLVREFSPVPPVLANESKLGQVFLNLLVNALQALPSTGTEVVTVRVSAPSPGVVRVEVRDTGEGIAPEVLPRVFDPFFTTKPVGVGTGLGLFVCQGIVTTTGGTIRIESEVAKGTTVTVEFPVAPGA